MAIYLLVLLAALPEAIAALNCLPECEGRLEVAQDSDVRGKAINEDDFSLRGSLFLLPFECVEP